jgi:hypothetical protein
MVDVDDDPIDPDDPDDPDDPSDIAALAGYAQTLADGVEAAVPAWVERCVERILLAYRGRIEPDERAAAVRAGEGAREELAPRVRQALLADVDAPAASPLSVVRGAVRFPTEVLRGAGVPPVVRDEFAERQFPEDLYDLSPASFADLDPGLQDPALRWGAARAHVHLARRRREGPR